MKNIILVIIFLSVSACVSGQSISYNKNKPTIIPELGIYSGYFYQEQEVFTGRTAGHTGILWAIHDGEKLVDIYFNEQARPNYHTLKFASQFKRLNDYDNMMAKYNNGIGWFNGVRNVELDYIKAGTLSTDIDAFSGASNTPENAMIPLAQKIQARIESGEKKQRAVRIVEQFEDGTVGDLLVVYNQNNTIVDFSFDELIPESIKDEKLIPYAGQSKRCSLDYKIPHPARYGYFFTIDKMKEIILQQNSLLAAESVFEDKFHDAKILPKFKSLVEKLENL